MKINEVAFLGCHFQHYSKLYSNLSCSQCTWEDCVLYISPQRFHWYFLELIAVLVECLQTVVLNSSLLLGSFLFIFFFGPKST